MDRTFPSSLHRSVQQIIITEKAGTPLFFKGLLITEGGCFIDAYVVGQAESTMLESLPIRASTKGDKVAIFCQIGRSRSMKQMFPLFYLVILRIRYYLGL